MPSLRDAVSEFLGLRRIAVAGVSRASDIPANTIYRRLREKGYEVFAVDPRATEVEGDSCYPDLKSVPAELQGIVVATPPEAAESVVRECVELGIGMVWMHRSFGQGSVSDEAVRLCREAGISLIPGACPMMYLEPVDFGHRCFRWFLGVSGKLPAPGGFPDRSQGEL
ncbi:CoA-binding protein [Gemmatimonadota bacterium]